jgi:hypothetical protein
MLSTSSTSKDKKDDPFYQFIKTTLTSQTLCISTCTLGSGGCHSFGESLALDLKSDYVGLKFNAPFTKIDIFKEKMCKPYFYENITITGCGFNVEKNVGCVIRTYNISNLKNLFLLAPPHNIVDDYEGLTKDVYSRHTSKPYKVTLISSGLGSHLLYNIGLPSPFPIKVTDETTNNISKNCLGLLYIRDLIMDNNLTRGDYIMAKETGDDKIIFGKARNFLKLYFSQINELAKDKSIELPSVIAITSDSLDMKIILQMARQCKIEIKFVDKLPPAEFVKTLEQLGEKNGIVGQNGVQSLIQAYLLNCQVITFYNKSNNKLFFRQLADFVSSELKPTAKVIMGLSDKTELLKNKKNVTLVHQSLQANFKLSSEKFATAKAEIVKDIDVKSTPTMTAKEITAQLTKLTGLPWAYDSKKKSAFTKGKIDESVLPYLKEQGFAVKKSKVAESASSMWANAPIIVISFKNEDFQKLFTVPANVQSPKVEEVQSTSTTAKAKSSNI